MCHLGGVRSGIFRQGCDSYSKVVLHCHMKELLTLSDGGQLALDWLHPDVPADNGLTPIVLILPGLTGNSRDSSYVLHVVQEVEKLRYRTCVFNRRGTGGIDLLTSKTYSAADTEDTDAVIAHVNRKFPNAPILAVGFSLGGMILFHYVCSKKSAKEAGIKAGLIVSAVWDPIVATESFERFWPRVLFNYRLGADLCNLVRPYKHLFSDKVDWKKLMRGGTTVRDFDTNFIVPMFGYSCVQEYYEDSALNRKVQRASVPILALNAADDCFSPVCTIPFDEIEQTENVAVALTTHGGHTAFMKHFSPSEPGLIEELFSDYAQMVFEHL